MTFVSNFFREFTKDRGPKKFDTQSQGQQDIFALIEQGLKGEGPFASIGQFDPESSAQRFNDSVAQPLITQFNEEILPGITGQFRGSGLGNSTFAGQASARAGEGLERQLSSGLAQFQGQEQQNASQNLQNLINSFLGQQTFGFKEQSPNLLTQLGVIGTGEGIKAAGAAAGGGRR